MRLSAYVIPPREQAIAETQFILLDMGNTLIEYMIARDVPALLAEGIGRVREYLRVAGKLRLDPEAIAERTACENAPRAAGNHAVRPLADRLVRIFDLDDVLTDPDELDRLCRQFMQPVFARGRIYDDTLPALKALSARGLTLAIVSNTPWGSPGYLWREELARMGVSEWFDVEVFCTDVGWRKPAREIYDYTLAKLGAKPDECLFVGDDDRWDVIGPREVGIDSLLLVRDTPDEHVRPDAIRRLTDIEDYLFLRD